MKSRKPQITFQEDNEEDDDAAFEEEEARFKAERLEKELEEQNKFDCLCDGVQNCLALVDSAFSELLDLKDELLEHRLPPSLQIAVTLVTSKLFRSISDLHTPIQELTRLVNLYSIPWEQRSESLKKLHNDYESKQRQLNIAIRRLQLIDAHSRRIDNEKRIMNWEKAFAKVTSAKTHGRRWKFMIEAFKKRVKEGINLSEMDVELSDDETEDGLDEEDADQDDGETEKQRFMMSVIAASPPAEEDGTPQAGSDIGSEADGIPSEISDSTAGNVEDTSPDIKRRRGVSFVAADDDDNDGAKEFVERIQYIKEEKPPCEDKAIWTDEPEYDTQLAVRLFRPTQLKDDEGLPITCSLMFGDATQKTAALPIASAMSPSIEPMQAAEEDIVNVKGKKKLKIQDGRRKSIGFASKPSSPAPAVSSPGKSMLKSKPGGILKKVKTSAEEEVAASEAENKVNREKYEEVIFNVDNEMQNSMQITIHQGEDEKMIAMSTLTWEELQKQEFAIKYEESSMLPEQEEVALNELEEKLNDQEFITLPMQGVTIGIGGQSPGVLGELPILCFWIKKKKEKRVNAEVNTDNLKELIEDVTGVNLDYITKEELVHMLSREYNDMSTSAMSIASSSSHKSGLIPLAELEIVREQHDLELKNIQDEYEVKVQQLLMEIEKMQTMQMHQAVAAARGNDAVMVQAHYADAARETVADFPHRPTSGGPQHAATQWRTQKFPQLPNWGEHLPANVWKRMKLLTEEMMAKKKQLDARIRSRIAINIEKKLASQYKLQRNENGISGPLQDVSLPALFMPSRSGNVYNPRARLYFHPTGTSGDLRLTQPPSIFQLPPLPEKAKMSVVNLFELSKNFEQPITSDWLNQMAAAPSRGSRATTAASRATPHTPAPTANVQSSDVC